MARISRQALGARVSVGKTWFVMFGLKTLGEGPHQVDGISVHAAGPFGTEEGAKSWAQCLPKAFTWSVEAIESFRGAESLDRSRLTFTRR